MNFMFKRKPLFTTLIGLSVLILQMPFFGVKANGLFSGNYSDNFIMRWAFQDMCDHVYDPRTVIWAWPTTMEPGGVRFDPKKVKPGDLIFVRDIELFIKEMHPDILVPYIMITHGEFRDTCLEYQLELIEDEKIIAWFTIHPPKLWHRKCFPLPLGIKQEKQYYLEKNSFNKFLKDLRENTPKTKLLYLNFDDNQNPERKMLNKKLQNKVFCSMAKERLSFTDYLKEMAEFKFTLSPRGWGPDSYRTWEALYVGCIPIVRRCQFDQLHVRSFLGRRGSMLDQLYNDLPILIIDDWNEITEEFLIKKYDEINAKKYDMSKLYMEYWQTKIKKIQQDWLNAYNY